MTSQDAPTPEMEFIEIYATHNFVEAQILEDLFKDHTIPTIARKIEATPMPTNVGQFGEHRLAVASGHVVNALNLVHQALADGAITPGEGDILRLEDQEG